MLNRGGGAELYDPELEEEDNPVWSSRDDPDFMAEFPEFLRQSDVYDILDYLEEMGELSTRDADRCEIREEFYKPGDLTGFVKAR